jgi:hypothetical protein
MNGDHLPLPATKITTRPAGALAYLRSIYTDPRQETHVRMRAAIAALPFEHPKLAVTAVIEGGADFAARLERACGRSAKVLELRRSPAVNDAAEVSAAAMRVPMAIPRGWRR